MLTQAWKPDRSPTVGALSSLTRGGHCHSSRDIQERDRKYQASIILVRLPFDLKIPADQNPTDFPWRDKRASDYIQAGRCLYVASAFTRSMAVALWFDTVAGRTWNLFARYSESAHRAPFLLSRMRYRSSSMHVLDCLYSASCIPSHLPKLLQKRKLARRGQFLETERNASVPVLSTWTTCKKLHLTGRTIRANSSCKPTMSNYRVRYIFQKELIGTSSVGHRLR